MTSLRSNISFWAFTATQFFGAFNDSAYRNFIVLYATYDLAANAVSWLPAKREGVIAGIFSIPFVLFALLAGSMADRYSKTRIIFWMKVAEIGVMALGMAAFAVFALDPKHVDVGVICSMVVLFLMGTHSAFFSPSKYGVIPEMVPEAQLTRANAIVSMTTQVAILLGIWSGARVRDFLHEYGLPTHYASVFFLVVAGVGTLAASIIQPVRAAAPERALEFNILRYTYQELKALRAKRDLFVTVFALSWWWLIAMFATILLNNYGKEQLLLPDGGTSLVFPLLIGVGFGSLLASKLSGEHIELGLVPIGAFGMACGFASLYFLEPTIRDASVAHDSVREYFRDPTIRHTWIALGIAGASAGLCYVPLAAHSQSLPDATEKGRVMGLLEFSTFLFIFLAALVHFCLVSLIGLDARETMLACGLLTLAGMAITCYMTPHYFARSWLWLLTHTIYRFKVLGIQHVPAKGGAVLVSNHVSYADPFVVGAPIPRYIRYLFHRSFVDTPFIGGFSRLMKAIPIAENDRPRELIKSLQEAADHAAAGNLLCIFAEGGISRTGNLLPFSKGLERIASRAKVPIIPVHIDGMWGSIFSFRGGAFFKKLPLRFPYKVTISYGPPLPPDTPVADVRLAVQELAAAALHSRKKRGRTLASEFIRAARRAARRPAMVDHTKQVLTYRRLLAGALLVRGYLRKRCRAEPIVGILLPASNSGALANVAVTLAGMTATNLNFTAGESALQAAAAQCGLKTILTSREFLQKAGIAPAPEHIDLSDICAQVTRVQRLRATLLTYLPAFLLKRMLRLPRDPDADAVIIFSSGSTGTPKGVCLTHHNILSNCHSFTEVVDLSRRDRMVAVLPLFHSFGYTVTVWCPLLNGLMSLYHPNPFDTQAIADLMREHRGTMLFATPTFYLSYLRRFKPEDVATLRFAMAGAEKLKPALANLWLEKFGTPILEGYGCTELSPVVAVNLPNVHHNEIEQIAGKPGTVGHPLPGVAAKVVDPDTFAPLPTATPGLLLIKGPNVMRGYLNRPDLTAEVMRDGWYITGDIASIDHDGFITITDRLSRFSKIGGEMVPHVGVESEIQSIALELQACSQEKREADECVDVAVTAIADESKGERLIVLHTHFTFPIDDILARLQARPLPKLWIPKKDSFFEVESLPKLGSGKLDLKAIKELALERAEGKKARST